MSFSGPPTTSTSTREKPPAGLHHRGLSPRRLRRVILSLVAVAIVLTLGTVGFYLVAGLGWVNSFYFECMLATGQGPPFLLTNDSAKLFASGMAFLSVGTVLTTLVVNFGPLIGQLWREGIERAERELKQAEGEVAEEFRGR
jgi:ABC-type molybdate transport system permease subunit